MYIGLHVQYPLFMYSTLYSCTVPLFMYSTLYSCPILMKLEFSQQIFEKYSNIKFRKNPSSGSRVVPCGQMDGRTDRQTGITKTIVAFRNFANAPKKYSFLFTSKP